MWLFALALTLLGPYVGPRVLLHLPPPITESSGLASSSRSDGWLFTHQDSGDQARFYAVSVTGRLLATYQLPGVQARDWEDMARGPDELGRSSLFLADVGDNRAVRVRGVVVHRVAEPAVDPTRVRVRTTTGPAVSWRLSYPDGPQDAETLLVDPRGGRLYIVTKSESGTAAVFAAPNRPRTDRVNVLQRTATVVLRPTGTRGGPGIGVLAGLLVTSGDVAPDRSRLALRTYTDLYEWELGDRDLAAALRGRPTVTALPATAQGEGLAYSRDGTAILLSSEGRAAPVHRLVQGGAAGAGTPPPAGPGTGAPATARSRSPTAAAPRAAAPADASERVTRALLGAAAALAVAALPVATVVARRRGAWRRDRRGAGR